MSAPFTEILIDCVGFDFASSTVSVILSDVITGLTDEAKISSSEKSFLESAKAVTETQENESAAAVNADKIFSFFIVTPNNYNYNKLYIILFEFSIGFIKIVNLHIIDMFMMYKMPIKPILYL